MVLLVVADLSECAVIVAVLNCLSLNSLIVTNVSNDVMSLYCSAVGFNSQEECLNFLA